MNCRFAVASGRPWPLGVTFEEGGANIAVFSAHAEAIELCLFDPTGHREQRRLRLPDRTGDVHHGFVCGLAAGQVYGLRAHGPWDPAAGHRFNQARLLLDPYAQGLVGDLVWAGPNLVDEADPFALDPRDSAPFVAKAVMLPPLRAVEDASRLRTPWSRTVLYELHVKGMTKLHGAVPEALRGTYAGLAHPAVIEHLLRLGITAVELLPVASFVDERRLVERGLVNHWGYNPWAFMVLERRYASGPMAGRGTAAVDTAIGAAAADPRAEFASMVAAFHAAGLEVILDIVLNHTGETDALGPALSFRGLDNATYYRLRDGDRRLYVDDTGTGNTLDLSRPAVLHFAMDVLRHWAALGVDGFRFDLGAILGRGRDGGFSAEAAFLQVLTQDPVLGGLKLIAEPWDIGPGGYRLGEFPAPMAEWSDRFRDGVRRFWRGDEGMVPELASRLSGSAELFEWRHRKSWTGINFITAHDGFTLCDLGTYAGRHNEANGENNRDGHHDNLSLNHGVEGPSDDPAILARRRRHARNLLATLLLSQGTPMLAMGDELQRSQGGNNNAYCQDNETSWVAWPAADAPLLEAPAMIAFVAALTALRRAEPALRRADFMHGRVSDDEGVADLLWFAPDGRPMSADAWRRQGNRTLAMMVNGGALSTAGDEPGGMLLILVNAAAEPATFNLPQPTGCAASWTLLLDTAQEATPAGLSDVRSTVMLTEHSLQVLRRSDGVSAATSQLVLE